MHSNHDVVQSNIQFRRTIQIPTLIILKYESACIAGNYSLQAVMECTSSY